MSNLREAAQQALEALEQCGLDDTHRSYEFEHAARAALRAALAEPEEQPMPPVPLATFAEQQAYVFGWFKALETTQHMHEALQIIATPQRPDGTWNRDREACRQIAAEALGFHNKGEQK